MSKTKPYIVYLAIILTFILGCGKIRYTKVYKEHGVSKVNLIQIFTKDEGVPANSQPLADFIYREKAEVSFIESMMNLEKIALDKGSNVILIKEMYNGSRISKKSKIELVGTFYSNSSKDKIYNHYDTLKEKESEALREKSIIYLYRNDYGRSALINMNVYVNGILVGIANSRSVLEIPIYKEGKVTISYNNNLSDALTFDVKLGKKYYVKAFQWFEYNINALPVLGGFYFIIETKSGKYFALISNMFGKLEYELVRQSIKEPNQ